MRIHRAEILDAMATSHMLTAWALGESFFHPKAQTAMKVDSRKKATGGLDGQQRTENVAHIAGIPGPVGAELELESDSGHHTGSRS